jgi:GDPmannose 4,6-dehydratase
MGARRPATKLRNQTMKRALITGITGQDGSYLAELLLSKGYEVHGVVRRSSSFNTGRIEHLYEDPAAKLSGVRLQLHYGDLSDGSSLQSIIAAAKPDEIYNMGAQSHVRVSFDIPEYTAEITGLGAVRMLEAIRRSGVHTRFYQASSSELFGQAAQVPQSENTPFNPRSPYGAAKAYAFYITKNYREAYNMFAVNGILFNHESERRGETFVTRKITRAVGRIKHGLQHELRMGNIDARRDWGHAADYMEAVWLSMQLDVPSDYVVGTGEMHTVREVLELAFGQADLDWKQYVKIDPMYFRPAEVDVLCADPSKAQRELGWKAQITFKELVRRMVVSDLELAAREKRARG